MKVLVTGGGGFLGSALVRLLLDESCKVVSLSRNLYPKLKEWGVRQYGGSLTDKKMVEKAVRDCELVFHVAAKAGYWGRDKDYLEINVTGTRHVIDACRIHGVSRLVYTSSPSVVFNGDPIEGGDERLPYARSFKAAYPRTKMLAEKMVLQANDESLATVALRPHLVWGPGDNHLVPRILARARAGKLKQVGNGLNKVDSLYIDNAAAAHWCAAKKLSPNAEISGKSYFITNGEPMMLWTLVNRILAAGGEKELKGSIPAGVAYYVGAVLESIYRLFRIQSEPRMTRFVAKELSSSHWFDISAARKELGYQPKVSIEEGLRRLQLYLQENGRSH